MKKVLVGFSGGVDSAVSAYLLKQQGYEVTAGFMINYVASPGEDCQTEKDIEVAKEVARYLKIPFFTFDYVFEYREKVLDYLYEGYQKGLTPNPDIMCNSEIKFKVFLDEALSAGFDYVATGHYARIELSPLPPLPEGEGASQDFIYHLKKGVDETKDQSYFLAGLNQAQLSKTLFPIGHLQKSQVRKIAKDIGLPNATRKDSQGICFVGKVDFASFLEKKIAPKPGNIVDTKGNILGKHKGVFYYTIGQRKGLDLGGQPKPVFVVEKNIEKNEIVVGDENDMKLYDDRLYVKDFHFLTSPPVSLLQGERSIKAHAKIRYRQGDQECEIMRTSSPAPLLKGEGEKGYVYEVKFKEKQRAIAPGQICAIYMNDELVMSGVISLAFPA